MSRTSRAIVASRSSVSWSRSSSEELSPFSRPASMSRSFASRISAERSSSAAASASSARSFVSVSSVASLREAAFACAQMSATDGVVVATG